MVVRISYEEASFSAGTRENIDGVVYRVILEENPLEALKNLRPGGRSTFSQVDVAQLKASYKSN